MAFTNKPLKYSIIIASTIPHYNSIKYLSFRGLGFKEHSHKAVSIHRNFIIRTQMGILRNGSVTCLKQNGMASMLTPIMLFDSVITDRI